MEMLENRNLDLLLQELGVMPVLGELGQLEELEDPRNICMQKGYYRSPYDEEGEITF